MGGLGEKKMVFKRIKLESSQKSDIKSKFS